MRRIIAALLVSFFTVAPFEAGAFAIDRYRCGGIVQSRPCTVYVIPQPQTRRAVKSSPWIPVPPPLAYTKGKFARVINPSFVRVNNADGLWKGRVEGNGVVHLELQIFRYGSFESRRYMGNIKLANKSTGFNFRSVTPRGRGWTWKVVAFAS